MTAYITTTYYISLTATYYISLTSTNLLYMRKRIESCLLLCRALGQSAASKRQHHSHFCLRCIYRCQNELHVCTISHLGQCWISPQVVTHVLSAFWAWSGPCSVWKQRGVGTACGNRHSNTGSYCSKLAPNFFFKASNTFIHAPYLLIISGLKLGWHQESSSVTSRCSRWLWPVTKDSAKDNLSCRMTGTHICRRKCDEIIEEVC